jgi:hypothetical protein
MYYVTKVRKHQAPDSSHAHLVGVVTATGSFYTNQQVVDSIDAGSEWFTLVAGYPNARIRRMNFCPASSTCFHKPYLTTDADRVARNNLENLPPG